MLAFRWKNFPDFETSGAKMNPLNELNPEQKIAAEHKDGPLLILAGAGSGKTKTITFRMLNLITHYHVSPENIIGVTFTNKAAKEMRERLKKFLPKNIKSPLLCTFHSLCIKILREHIHHFGYHSSFTIYDTSDQLSLIRQSLENRKDAKKFDRKIIQSIISKLKNNSIGPEDFVSSKFFDPTNNYHLVVTDVYPDYQKKLKLLNALDFDDLLFITVILLKNHPSVAMSLSQQFRYITVDEYQDTNPMQLDLIKSLTCAHQNICVVGDDDQSIYAFRGADVQIILNFNKHFKNAKTVSLEQNYRSTTPILNLANAMIAQNKNRHQKKLWSKYPSDELPLLWGCQDDDHEALIIADDINQMAAKGTAWSSMLILCRSNNQFIKIEDALKEGQIPYQLFGGQKFYEKKEIKDLISYLSFISNPKDDISLRRIINVPSRGIGDVTLENLNSTSIQDKLPISQVIQKNFATFKPSTQNALKSFLDLIQELRGNLNHFSLSEFVQELIKKTDYISYVQQYYKDQSLLAEIKKNDVLAFAESARRFQIRHETHSFKKAGSTRELLYEFLQFCMTQNNPQDDDEDESESPEKIKEMKNYVSVMTMHGSKGLEFDNVYIVGVEDEILPHKKTLDANEDVSEERRLFYVAITRAKKRLVMSYSKEKKIYNAMKERLKSRFLYHLDEYYTFQDRTNFGHLTKEEAENYKKNFFQDLSKLLD